MGNGIIHNEYTMGLARLNVRVQPKLINKDTISTMLFAEGFGSDQEFIKYSYREHGVTLPEEAVRGLDAHRVNFGVPFNENFIYGQYFDERYDVDLDQAQKTMWMEDIANPWSVERRQMYLLSEGRETIRERNKMAKEKVCVDLILTGKFKSRQNGGAEQVFPVDADLLALDGSTLFTDPMTTISKAAMAIQKKGHTVSKILMNPMDALNLLASEKWLAMLDNRRVIGNMLNPTQTLPNGIGYVGTIVGISAGAMEIYTYDGTYTTLNADGSTTESYYIPQGKAIIYGDTIGKLCYTSILVNDGSGYQKFGAGKESFLVCTESDGPRAHIYIEGQYSPCPILDTVDHYGVLSNIPASA